jgi:acyl-CoA thioesterase II
MTGADGILRLLAPKSDGGHGYALSVSRALCLGPPNAKHMSGGASLACAVLAIEAATGRVLVQAHAQFLSAPGVGAQVVLQPQILQSGRTLTQARTSLTVDGQDRVLVSAALGGRADPDHLQWGSPPDAPAPDTCPPIPFVRADDGDLHTHLDMRLARDERAAPQGRLAFWVKAADEGMISAAFLALIADYLPEALHMNLGRKVGAVSLDNVLRVVRLAPSPWVLCDTRLSGVSQGMFHGAMSIFSQDGDLLAVGGQSGVVRTIAG